MLGENNMMQIHGYQTQFENKQASLPIGLVSEAKTTRPIYLQNFACTYLTLSIHALGAPGQHFEPGVQDCGRDEIRVVLHGREAPVQGLQ